jgi:hypothetical protein
MKLNISKNLALPLEAVTSTFGLLAVRGAGKSNAARVMAEEMFRAGLPFVYIDPVGSAFGLRSGRDGKPKGGLPIPIFGGRHGDVPLERGAGELIADLIVERRLSCVVDVSTLESESDKKTFLLTFARRLYQKNKDPLHLFLEEADDFIPQKPMRDEAQMLRAWENIVRRGRSRGIGCTIITQRSAAVNKMVLTQVETLFVLRTTGPQDIAAIEAWTKYHQVGRELLASLAGLGDGEAWAWSPHFLGTPATKFCFRLCDTFDSGATPKNVRGADARKAATLADVDLDDLRGRIAETIERAKADDPKVLRAEIAKLKREAGSQQVNAELQAEIERLGGQIRALQLIVPAATQLIKKLETAIAEFRNTQFVAEGVVVVDGPGPSGERRFRQLPLPPAIQPPPKETFKQKTEPYAKKSASSQNGHALPSGEQLVLDAIAQHERGCTAPQITILTGYKTRTRQAYLQRLGARELVTKGGDRFQLTPEGRKLASATLLPKGQALQSHWMLKLPEGEGKILAEILAEYPNPVRGSELTARTNYKDRTRQAYLQRLGARELVRKQGDSYIAAEEFFE